MEHHLSQRTGILSLLLLAVAAWGADEQPNAANRALGFIPWIGNNPCANRYLQVAVSPPLQDTSSGDEGFPWRALFGYCVAQSGRLSLHQDWALSYLDVEPQGGSPGGDGVGLGTDFLVQWRHRLDGWTPYYEAGLGIQYAVGTPFPAHGSRWMFTNHAGIGLAFPLEGGHEISAALRYLHISNAGWLGENAGYDAFHLFFGLRW
jgi:hypothetical protein